MTELVFVYGTLKRGWGNCHRCLAESKFLGEAISFDANYKMRGSGVPFLSEGGSAKVKGELFEVPPSDLARCDRLEGHPHAYKREQRLFILENHPWPVQAWVYFYTYREPYGYKPVHGVLEWKPDARPY